MARPAPATYMAQIFIYSAMSQAVIDALPTAEKVSWVGFMSTIDNDAHTAPEIAAIDDAYNKMSISLDAITPGGGAAGSYYWIQPGETVAVPEGQNLLWVQDLEIQGDLDLEGDLIEVN